MKKENLSIIGAVFTALLSTLCCLPAFLFLFFGISSAALTYLSNLGYIRIPLGILTIILLVYAFIRFKRKVSCECSKKDLVKNYTISIFSFFLIVFLLFYPELLPYFMD